MCNAPLTLYAAHVDILAGTQPVRPAPGPRPALRVVGPCAPLLVQQVVGLLEAARHVGAPVAVAAAGGAIQPAPRCHRVDLCGWPAGGSRSRRVHFTAHQQLLHQDVLCSRHGIHGALSCWSTSHWSACMRRLHQHCQNMALFRLRPQLKAYSAQRHAQNMSTVAFLPPAASPLPCGSQTSRTGGTVAAGSRC